MTRLFTIDYNIGNQQASSRLMTYISNHYIIIIKIPRQVCVVVVVGVVVVGVVVVVWCDSQAVGDA